MQGIETGLPIAAQEGRMGIAKGGASRQRRGRSLPQSFDQLRIDGVVRIQVAFFGVEDQTRHGNLVTTEAAPSKPQAAIQQHATPVRGIKPLPKGTLLSVV